MIKRIERICAFAICSILFAGGTATLAQTDEEVVFRAIEIFPLVNQHVHGSTIVELPNGDLLAAWFQGSGERWADDVAIMGLGFGPAKTNGPGPL